MATNLDATAASLAALTENHRTITFNLSNASTTGYKRMNSAFTEAMEAQTRAQNKSGIDQYDRKVSIDFAQGAFVHTERPLDTALNGPGFFVVETSNGLRYTRKGQFKRDPDGILITADGKKVMGSSGQPITIPPEVGDSKLNITREGKILANGQEIDQLKVVEFQPIHVKKLHSVGDCCFEAPKGIDPTDSEKTIVSQGYQESSNVNIVTELVNLITVSRLYETNMKAIEATDGRMKNILGIANG